MRRRTRGGARISFRDGPENTTSNLGTGHGLGWPSPPSAPAENQLPLLNNHRGFDGSHGNRSNGITKSERDIEFEVINSVSGMKANLPFGFPFWAEEVMMVHLRIWDTVGQENFKAISSSYYRCTHGVIATSASAGRVARATSLCRTRPGWSCQGRASGLTHSNGLCSLATAWGTTARRVAGATSLALPISGEAKMRVARATSLSRIRPG
ncbi:hypothetical protein EJ110_NYTH48276 [Nymphaea thermarum]|nr:hypothetical protein EJ110_NYTH48276 [Nymphaea thermarum]